MYSISHYVSFKLISFYDCSAYICYTVNTIRLWRSFNNTAPCISHGQSQLWILMKMSLVFYLYVLSVSLLCWLHCTTTETVLTRVYLREWDWLMLILRVLLAMFSGNIRLMLLLKSAGLCVRLSNYSLSQSVPSCLSFECSGNILKHASVNVTLPITMQTSWY